MRVDKAWRGGHDGGCRSGHSSRREGYIKAKAESEAAKGEGWLGAGDRERRATGRAVVDGMGSQGVQQRTAAGGAPRATRGCSGAGTSRGRSFAVSAAFGNPGEKPLALSLPGVGGSEVADLQTAMLQACS